VPESCAPRQILAIPAHRPIKPLYIKDLVEFLDRVIEAEE